jgi:hypothetical protein
MNNLVDFSLFLIQLVFLAVVCSFIGVWVSRLLNTIFEQRALQQAKEAVFFASAARTRSNVRHAARLAGTDIY